MVKKYDKAKTELTLTEVNHKFYDKKKDELIIELINAIQAKKDLSKNLAEKLERSNEKLKEYNETRSEFISVATHQLKNSITAISWIGELLYKKLNSEQAIKLKKILKANEQILFLVNDMLDIAKLETRKIAGFKKNIDLLDLVNEILLRFKDICDEKKQKVKIFIVPSARKFFVKINFLDKILDNLISNAVKYTPINGIIKIKGFKKNNAVFISVEDNGIGIPDSEQKNIFQKFFRASNVQKSFEGTGLGLALVKGFVEKLKGEITFYSKEGSGSKFIVKLPLKTQALKNASTIKS